MTVIPGLALAEGVAYPCCAHCRDHPDHPSKDEHTFPCQLGCRHL